MASICDTPLTRISRTGTRTFAGEPPAVPRPRRRTPSAPARVLTPRSTTRTRNVARKRSPPWDLRYTSSCSTAKAEKAKKMPLTATRSFASVMPAVDLGEDAADADAEATPFLDRVDTMSSGASGGMRSETSPPFDETSYHRSMESTATGLYFFRPNRHGGHSVSRVCAINKFLKCHD